jgi:SAM-dependent methyltransferase
MAAEVPKHWSGISWEEKARENPLYAVMTTDEVVDAGADNFDPKHLEVFFAKGEALYAKHVAPLLARSPDSKQDTLVMEYGCGAGRLLAQLVKGGYRCAGIDISETMLRHCRDLVPDVEATYLLDNNGECEAATASASIVYSYAVVQHISKLSNYERAFDVMCRVLKPGGIIAVQVNCEDFVHGDINTPWRTENEETRSLHYKAGEDKPYTIHKQDDWSGVYIGHERLIQMFAERGVSIESRYYHNPNKLRGVWYVGVKKA